MPDNPTDRIRRLLQQARQSLDTLSSALDEIEAELQAMDFEVPGEQAEVPQLTPEELEIASVKMLLTFQEAAGLMGVSIAGVREMVDQGELSVFKIGPRTLRIPVKQLKEHIEAVRGG